jgi:steroid delta-isomerase-like uncharacterized protein
MSDKHEAIIRRYYHDLFGMGRREMKAIDHYMAADFVAHDLPLAQKSCEDYMRFISMFEASFSDMNHIIRDIFSCDDKVVARWSWTAKHTAEFMGIPATNRQITIKGIDIYRLTDGKIANLWQEIDIMGILQQISAPPGNGIE